MAKHFSRLTSVTSHLLKTTTITTTITNTATIATTNPFSTSTPASGKPGRIKMESTFSPPSGLYQPNYLQSLYYGPGTVKAHLLSCLPSSTSKAFIITGNSLATKTPLIQQVEDLLTPAHHAGTFSRIGQHAPVADLDAATSKVKADASIDTIISIGGGSPIDSAKAISHRVHESTESGKYLHHICIPTTLSAAECTFIAGYTTSSGLKTSVSSPHLSPAVIIYDASFALHTPPQLFLSTGLRAMDHALEMQYHPSATDVPCRSAGRAAVRDLFLCLPRYKANPKDEDVITRLQLAAFNSLGFLGRNITAPLGLSHTFGYALGSPYGIPHGVTSCLTLGHVVKFQASRGKEPAKRCADVLPFIVTAGSSGEKEAVNATSGNDVEDGEKVGDAVLDLVQRLGLKTTLTEHGVGKDQTPVICERATGGKKAGDELYDGVKGIVEKLF